MFSRQVRILNFDDSIIQQLQLIQQFNPAIIDLTKIGPSCRLWANRKSIDEIRKFLKSEYQNAITFLGSGDFHHISSLLIEQFSEPISVVIFDFHPDWDILPPRLGCGSWVTNILRNNNIRKVILVGVSSEDLSNIKIQTGNLKSLGNNRVEIYPYQHTPSYVFLKSVTKNISLDIKKGFLVDKIYWKELKGKNLIDFFLSLIKRLPTKRVYISIDKDCLKDEYALTNWESGLLSLDELLMMLTVLKENLDIIGMDIVGDYSRVSFNSHLKEFFSRLDHPKDIRANRLSDSFINTTNQNTNLKILETLTA